MKYGLISSEPVNSFLYEIHQLFFKEEPQRILLSQDQLERFLSEQTSGCFYVSGYFQREIMKYLDEADESAERCGCADTVLCMNGQVKGYNLLFRIFPDILNEYSDAILRGRTAILGNGETSSAIRAALNGMNAQYDIVTDSPSSDDEISDAQLKESAAVYTCIINTTKTGEDPDTAKMPADPSLFTNLKTVIDLVENPLRTAMILQAHRKGIRTLSGAEILFRYVRASYELFTGEKTDDETYEIYQDAFYRRHRNVVLIGMPTCGKSTFASILSGITGRQNIEMDAQAEKILGTSISECFAAKGEAYFRAVETETAHRLYEGTGRIISCGGGVIKTPETMRWLCHNGFVIWLSRDLSRLFPTGDRPLSRDRDHLSRLYEERKDLYQMYADCIIDNNGPFEKTARSLLHAIHERNTEYERRNFHDVTVKKGIRRFSALRIPSSKSLSHRALIASALADGVSSIRHCGRSDDLSATQDALRVLGAHFEREGNTVTVTHDTARENTPRIIDCRESATTLRFLIPLFALSETETVFKGQGRLLKRPLDVYADIFAKQNLLFENDGETLRIKGPLKPGIFETDGNISSQFVSGLLFALPLLEGDSEIHVKPPVVSSSYIRLTLDILKQAGIEIIEKGNAFLIRGNQKYQSCTYDIPGDDSQAGVAACLALLNRSPVHVLNMDHDSHQGDHAVVEIMRRFGAEVTEMEEGFLFSPAELRGTEIDLSDTPDLGPVLFALAAAVDDTTVFRNAGRLRHKESDRIAAMQEELGKLGVKLESEGDTVIIHGQKQLEGGITLDGHRDHRIVMALAVLCAACEKPLRIIGADAVHKSWPGFFRDLVIAGMKVAFDGSVQSTQFNPMNK